MGYARRRLPHSSMESMVPLASIRDLNLPTRAAVASSSRVAVVISMVSYFAIFVHLLLDIRASDGSQGSAGHPAGLPLQKAIHYTKRMRDCQSLFWDFLRPAPAGQSPDGQPCPLLPQREDVAAAGAEHRIHGG